ncbi:MAG: lysophospholipid acyltransferase family protein [Deltaproteobacteria bacterium]|nr:lysophospholipid acyltransferase family protein [Deltaproteobacteria bacterium]
MIVAGKRILEVFLRIFGRRRVALKNLDVVFPEKTREEKEYLYDKCVSFFWSCLCEILSLKIYKRSWLEQNVIISNRDELVRISRLGCVFLSAHFSNFEILPQLAYQLNQTLRFIAKPVRPTFLNKIILGLRERNGAKFTGNPREVVSCLRENGCVGFLFDQHSSSKKSAIIPFCSVNASFNPFIFVLSSTAPTIFCYLIRTKEKYVLQWKYLGCLRDYSGRDDFAKILNSNLEGLIRNYPEQYFWFHRRWKASVDYGS